MQFKPLPTICRCALLLLRSLQSANFATSRPKVHHCACVCGVVTTGSLSTRRFWVTNVNRPKLRFVLTAHVLPSVTCRHRPENPALAVRAGCHRRHGLRKRRTCYVSNRCVLNFLFWTGEDSYLACLHFLHCFLLQKSIFLRSKTCSS